jgi:hypothetical protein
MGPWPLWQSYAPPFRSGKPFTPTTAPDHIRMMPDLADDDARALAQHLRHAVDEDPFPHAPRVESDPAQARGADAGASAAADSRHGATPRNRLGREARVERLRLLAVCLALFLVGCARGNTFAGPDPGGGFECPNNAFEDCADPLPR